MNVIKIGISGCKGKVKRSHGGVLEVTTPIEPHMTSYIIETVRTKCIIGEALKVRGQKHDKLSIKIVQKALKWPLQYANFQKFSGDPLESFLALKLLIINSVGKNALDKSDNKCPLPEKILNTPLT